MMPGQPAVGQKFCREQAPGVGMDQAEILSLDESVTTPAARSKRVRPTINGTRPAWAW